MKKALLSLLLAIACMPMAFGQTKGSLVTTDTTVCSKFLWTVDSVEYDHDTTLVYQKPGDTTGTVYVLHLTMLARNYDTINVREKTGHCVVNWNHKSWTEEGTFFDTITPARGCDTIVKIHITLTAPDTTWQTATACDKYVFHGDTLTTGGDHIHVDSATSTSDCRVYGVHLTLSHHYRDTASTMIENIVGGCRVVWLNHTYTYEDTNQTFYGMGKTVVGNCDSLMAMRITDFTHIQRDTAFVENCGRYTWSVNGVRYDSAGVYSVVDTTSPNCTQHNTLVLQLIDNYDTIPATACEKYTYTFDSRSNVAGALDTAHYTASGTYDTDEFGRPLYSTHFSTRCVTHHTLVLNVKEPAQRINYDTVVADVCDLYRYTFIFARTFDHSTDTTLVYSRRTVDNCYDTSIHFKVNIRHKSYKDYNETACDSYFWPFTGETYTTSTTQTKVLDGLKNSENCDSVGRLKLVVHYTPEVSIVGNWHVQPGETAHLKAVYNSSDNPTFKWFKNDTEVPGLGPKKDSLDVSGTGNTDIRLETTGHYTNSHTCTASNWITVTFSVGIDEVEGLNVNLYPNPASRFVNVESADVISEVEVYNALGQQVIRRSVNATATQLDLGALAIGNYTLRIVAANGDQTTRKFIVNK